MTLVNPDKYKTENNDDPNATGIKIKQPKRILHFCDGVLEEYSTDEEEVDSPTKEQQTVVDPSTLSWGPWFVYKAWAAGTSTLSIVDATGEFLASLFGITTPRYYFELEEYKRRMEISEKEEAQKEGWSKPSKSTETVKLNDMVSTSQPEPVQV